MAIDSFSFTGAQQTWVVPAGLTTCTIRCWGAQGGSAGSGTDPTFTVLTNGGAGGYATGDLAVTPGETLYVFVGGNPTGLHTTGNSAPVAGGYNGGGTGERVGPANASGSGGGGGASDVRQGSNVLADRVIVAGGGGSAGNYAATVANSGNGGAGGAATGGTGTAPNKNGSGGTQSAGGTTGGTGGVNGSAGALGVGGAKSSSTSAVNPGSGGGGYWGGGGGGYRTTATFGSGGGGGGSNYVGGVTASTSTQGGRSGNGRVEIEYVSAVTADPTPVAQESSAYVTVDVVNARREPRREYLWVRNRRGQQIGVIR